MQHNVCLSITHVFMPIYNTQVDMNKILLFFTYIAVILENFWKCRKITYLKHTEEIIYDLWQDQMLLLGEIYYLKQ